MKKYFFTGLALLLPIALTFIIVVFLFNLLTAPFVGILASIGIEGQLLIVLSKILILVLIFFFIVFIGFIAQAVFFHYLIMFWDYIFHRIPIFRTIYKTSKNLITTIFSSDSTSFKQVVLAPYPSSICKSVGFVTRSDMANLPEQVKENNILVFVPTSPNPTSGFLMLYKKMDLIYLDMSVEEAMKYVISCGVVSPKITEMLK